MDDDRITALWELIEQNLPFLSAVEFLQKWITDFENGCRDFLAQYAITKLILFCHNQTQTNEDERSLCELTKNYVQCAQKNPETSWCVLDSVICCWKDQVYVAECPCGEWVFQYMADRGADLNARNYIGTSVLHSVVRSSEKHETERLAAMNILLKNRVHPDYRAFCQATPLNLAKSSEEKSLLRKHYSLQCLATEVIIKNNIRFNFKIPKRIRKIINAHQQVHLPYGSQEDELLSLDLSSVPPSRPE